MHTHMYMHVYVFIICITLSKVKSSKSTEDSRSPQYVSPVFVSPNIANS
jgi:hypothetical protein